MGVCSYCGAQEAMPFICKFCTAEFCAEHHLPENHVCQGLKEFKEHRSKTPEKWIYEPFHEKYKARAGREIRKPLMQRISRFILYVILTLIFIVLILNTVVK